MGKKHNFPISSLTIPREVFTTEWISHLKNKCIVRFHFTFHHYSVLLNALYQLPGTSSLMMHCTMYNDPAVIVKAKNPKTTFNSNYGNLRKKKSIHGY